MDPLIIGAIGVAILAVAALGLALRNRDTSTAIGQLSGETVKRDRKLEVPEPEAAAAGAVGRQVEAVGSARGRAALVAAESAPPVAYVPPDPETIGVARRQFLNRGILAMFGLGLTSFGAASIGFLWPQNVSGFGSKVTVGRIPDIQAAVIAGGGFFYVPEGRMWITEYPSTALEKASEQYGFFGQVEQGLNAGVTAIYQTCPHLGCRVPECLTSQWFECPCHGSQYNRVGEKKGGPAPRGMDRFPMEGQRSERADRRHGYSHSGSRNRNQHHRPGGRRSQLHQRSRGTLNVRNALRSEHNPWSPDDPCRRLPGDRFDHRRRHLHCVHRPVRPKQFHCKG